MPELSLTKFVDFVCKSGTPKYTVIRQAWLEQNQEYKPEHDFYKPLREAICGIHRHREPIATLDEIVNGLKDPKKRSGYPEIVAGYRRWLGRRQHDWFEPCRTCWTCEDLTVFVNPELGLRIDGTPHLIKLYFKADALAKNRADLIAHLMSVAASKLAPSGCVMGVLDVRRARLITPPVPKQELTYQLEGEAAYWLRVWATVGVTGNP